MQKCPNCGQETRITEDWACQWCSYPLFSKSYKKIPKTYTELKKENLPPHTPEPEPTLELEPEPAAEPVPEPKPEPTPEPEPTLELEPEPAAEPVPEPKPEPTPEPKPTLKPKPELVTESKPETVTEPIPTAIEVTVEDLLSAYETDGVAADAKFINKILRITGVVVRIEVKDILDIHYITLTGAEKKQLQNVRCTFDKKHGPELSQLTTGQTVTVQGQYDGSIIEFRMKDCVLVR